MLILPAQYSLTPAAELLEAAERGLVGFDRRLISALIERRDETLAALAEFGTTSREDSLLDLTEQVFDLYRYFRSPEGIPFYIALLDKYSEETPGDELVEALSAQGAAALEPLLELHAGATPERQADLVFLLSTLGVHDSRIRTLIEKAIVTDPYEGALCAGLNADPELRATLEQALAACADDKAHAEERRALSEALEALDLPAKPDEPAPYDILSEYPEMAMPLFDHVEAEEAAEFLECADADYRAQAALSFSGDAYSDAVRDRLLAMARTDEAVQARSSALRALGERVDEKDVREFLITVLNDRRDDWQGALIGLAGATAEPAVYDAILQAYEAEETRAVALEAMWKSRDPRFKKYIGPNLRHDDPEIRRQAVQGVGAFPISELAIELVPLFDDEALREEALFAYTLALDHHTTPKTVAKLYERIDEKAGGLSDSEQESVEIALDVRLEQAGYKAVYFPPEEHDHDHDDEPIEQAHSDKVGRNDPCPCGSGKKYKKCCGA